MAEYKTYVCDHCGKKEAIHLSIPGVDYYYDCTSGTRQYIAAHVDLCQEHLEELFPFIVSDFSTEMRRNIWKKLLGK